MSNYRRKLVQVLNKNKISTDKYEIQPYALSDKQEIIEGMDCRSLDDLAGCYATPFGVLKADIKSMGLKFVHSAEKTIRKDRRLSKY